MKPTLLFALTSLSLLAACGGGGNKNGGNQPSAMIPITSANATTATRASYAAARSSAGLGDLSGETGFIAGGTGGVNKVRNVVSAANKGTSGASLVPIPATESMCDVSGKVTISGNIADVETPTLSKGDYFDLSFDQCIDTPGEKMHGDLRFKVDAFSGDFLGGAFNMTMTLTLDNFQVSIGTDVLTTNGEATVMLDTLDPSAIATSVSGSSITVDANTKTETLFDFLSAQTLNSVLVPSPYTTSASGTLDTTELAGSVRYSTPVTFEGFDNDYPGIGEFLVNGDGSSARLIAESNLDVRIELDTDGDGEINETINTTWAEIAD